LEGEGDDESSGLECEICVVRVLNVREGGFRKKFVKVCE